MRSILTTILAVFVCFGLKAQSLHLTQFYTNNQMVNPALTADNDGDFKWGANYRNQWPQFSTPLVTMAMGLEKRFYKGQREIQLGLLIDHDRFESLNLNSSAFLLAFGYPLKMGKHRITPALQAGMRFQNGNYDSRSHPSQWNYQQGEFDLTAASGESNLTDRIQYLNVNAGLTHSFRFGKNHRWRWGYALHNVNRPNVSPIDEDKLPFRHTAHLDMILNMGTQWLLLPDARITTTTKTENFMVGGRVMYKQTGSFYNAVYGGAFYRSNLDYEDAITPVFGIIFKTIDIGVSYDFNISDLSTLGQRKSTLELSVTYQTPSSSPDRFSVPCIRY